jgi:hypothetical protein
LTTANVLVIMLDDARFGDLFDADGQAHLKLTGS